MGFDTIAPHYRWMESVFAGNQLQRCRTAFLPRLSSAKRILIVGEGNGRFLVECRRTVPEASITCVDGSARMLALAGQRLHRNGLASPVVTFIHADVLEWKPRGVYDVIVTHFFLDCFPAASLQAVIQKLAAAASDNALWLLADFQVPAKSWRGLRARLVVRFLYQFFRVATRLQATELTEPDPYLRENWFQLQSRNESDWGLLRSDCWHRSNIRKN